MNKIIYLKKFLKTEKNILTRDSSCVYDESAIDSSVVGRRNLNNIGGQPPIKDMAVFLCPAKGSVCPSASERLSCSLPMYEFSNRWTPFLRKKLSAKAPKFKHRSVNMTKIINNQKIRTQYKNDLSTLQMLFKQYMELKVNWYKGKYTSEQEGVFCEAYFALQKALVKLPAIVPQDKQIKLSVLKDIIALNVEVFGGNYDLEKGGGFEEEAFNLIDQLLAA